MKKFQTIPTQSSSPFNERLKSLRDLIPEAFSEGHIDFEKLRTALGDLVDEAPERYSFTWAGKHDALRLLQTPTRATLIPAPYESLDWDTTHNIFIEGDNLEALKLLYKPYFGRVKMIYIDPPYNTGNDFIYPDDYKDPLEAYLKLTKQSDEAGNLLTSNPETSGRYHSAWLSMMYPRLFLARQLLREDGVIFVSIDDHEIHNLRMVMNEIFGEENFIATLIWQKMDSPSRNDVNRAVSDYHDYIFVYARNKLSVVLYQMPKLKILDEYPITLPDGRLARRRQLRKNGKGARREDRPTMWYELIAPDGSTVLPIAPEGWEGRWVLSKDTWLDREELGLTQWIKRDYGWVPYYIEVAPIEPSIPWSTLWTDVDQNRQAKAEFTEIMGSGINFENPKPVNLIQDILRMSSTDKDICMDFFSGSATLAHSILELNREDTGNRHFILVQLPEPTNDTKYSTIAEIGKERIRRIVKRMKSAGNDPQMELPLKDRQVPEDLGFRVFKLAASNFEPWVGVAEDEAEQYADQMALFRDPLVEGWTVEGVLAELAIKHGFGLDYTIEMRAFHLPGSEKQSVDFYQVTDRERDQSFYGCLAARLTLIDVGSLQLESEDLFICRDAALDDETAANLALQCRLETI